MDTMFKTIEIDLEKEIPNKDIGFVRNILNFFPKNEFAFDLLGGKAIIYLNKLDFQQFQKIIKSGMESTNSDATKKLLNDILINIDSIKSYGLKSKKRIYIGLGGASTTGATGLEKVTDYSRSESAPVGFGVLEEKEEQSPKKKIKIFITSSIDEKKKRKKRKKKKKTKRKSSYWPYWGFSTDSNGDNDGGGDSGGDGGGGE